MNQINPPSLGESTSNRNVYEIVTEQIIRQLEQGVAPWHKLWRTEAPCNLLSGKAYRGINVFLLASQGYAKSPHLEHTANGGVICALSSDANSNTGGLARIELATIGV